METVHHTHRPHAVFSLWHIPTSAVLREDGSLADTVAHVRSLMEGGVPIADLMIEEMSADRQLVRQLLGEQILGEITWHGEMDRPRSA